MHNKIDHGNPLALRNLYIFLGKLPRADYLSSPPMLRMNNHPSVGSFVHSTTTPLQSQRRQKRGQSRGQPNLLVALTTLTDRGERHPDQAPSIHSSAKRLNDKMDIQLLFCLSDFTVECSIIRPFVTNYRPFGLSQILSFFIVCLDICYVQIHIFIFIFLYI